MQILYFNEEAYNDVSDTKASDSYSQNLRFCKVASIDSGESSLSHWHAEGVLLSLRVDEAKPPSCNQIDAYSVQTFRSLPANAESFLIGIK